MLRCGTWHGDWTTGNMAAAPGRLLVHDWGRSGTAVPLGLDTAYFVVHEALNRLRWRGLAAARSEVHSMLFDLDSNHHAAWLLVDLALLEMTVRFQEARRHDMDVDGSMFESVLEKSLEEHGG